MKKAETIDRSFLEKYSFVPFAKSQVMPHQSYQDGSPLPDNFQPSEYDVICGRGKLCYNHAGNKRFRVTVSMHLEKYLKARTKLEKSLVVMSIVDGVRDSSPSAGFVKKDFLTGKWHVVGDHLAREKVGHALRDTIKATQDTSRNNKPVPSRKSIEKKQQSLLRAQQEIFRRLQEEDLHAVE